MKVFFAIIYLAIAVCATGQELERNEVDKYLKISVKETTWFKIKTEFTNMLACRAKKADNTYYLELSISMHSAFFTHEGDHTYLLFDDETSLPIECVRGGTAEYNYNKYASYWNGKYLYKLQDSDLDILKTKKLIGVRMGLGDEYKTFEGIRDKNQLRLQKAITLITD